METEEKGVVTYEARDGQQVKLSFATIKKFLVHGHPEWVTDQEMVYFMGICRSRALNPFAKDCYLIKYSQKDGAAIITSIDYFRKRAKAQKDCKGWNKGIIVERDNEVKDSFGVLLESDTLLGAWFEAQPEGWEKPFRLEVNLSGYIKKRSDGQVTKFWSKENQPSQIAKVVESQGLRTLWPDEFQQLYTPEEIGEGDMFKSTEIASSETEDLNDKLKGKSTPDVQDEKKDIYKAEEPEKKEKKTRKYTKKKVEAEPTKEVKEGDGPTKPIGPDPTFPPDPDPDETEGDPGTENITEKIIRLVAGAKMDENLKQPAVKCPNREGKWIATNWCLGNCQDRAECEPWKEFDKE